MARAHLIPTGYQGKTAYELEANPWERKAYPGPPNRDWHEPEIQGGELAFYWRSGSDQVLEAAAALTAGQLSLEAALGKPAVIDYVQRRFEDYLESLEDSDEEEAPREFPQFADRLLEPASLEDDIYEKEFPCGYYHWENDVHLRDARQTLEVPPWAHWHTVMAGGPGSGYDAQFLILDPPYTLKDLYDWLVDRSNTGAV